VQKAMVDDWKAAMTWMERKFPDLWSRGERREITGAGGGPVEVNDVSAREQLAGLLAGMRARGAAAADTGDAD